MNATQISKLMGTAARAAAPAAKLKKATQEIEAIFVKDLMAAMRRTAKHESLGNSLGGEMVQDMFDQALSEGAAKTGTLGIAQTIFRQMAPQAIRAALIAASAPNVGAPISDRGQTTPAKRGQDALATHPQDAGDTRQP